jgi:hypothetical protein
MVPVDGSQQTHQLESNVMSMKSITALSFTAALIAFGAAPAIAQVNPTASVTEASEAGTPRLDETPSNYRRGSFGGGGRSVSFHRASVRHVSFHRHSFARAHVRFGGGHRAPTRFAHNGHVRYPRVTYNTRVQTPRIRSPRVQQTRRPDWRNNPLLNVRSG